MSTETSSSLPERRFKLVVLGATGVGKTCLTLRFVRGVFEDDQLPTIGAAYLTKSLKTRAGNDQTLTNYVYEIWDTAGQERYESITPLYYRSAQAAVIVFDVQDKQSFNKAKDWLMRLRKELDNPNMPIALAANKFDTEQTSLVDLEEAEAFAQEHHMKMFRVSAKTGMNVDELFAWLAATLPPPPAPQANEFSGANPVQVRAGGLGGNKPNNESCC